MKKAKIIEFGIPYATLLYMRGHIMLYTGVIDDKISVTHASWGLKLKIMPEPSSDALP